VVEGYCTLLFLTSSPWVVMLGWQECKLGGGNVCGGIVRTWEMFGANSPVRNVRISIGLHVSTCTSYDL